MNSAIVDINSMPVRLVQFDPDRHDDDEVREAAANDYVDEWVRGNLEICQGSRGGGMSEWVDVSERLPDECKLVIVWVDRYGYYPDYMDVSTRQDGRWMKHSGTWQRISHWQPMPPPPK